jgi:hypothetical protein
MAAAFGSFFSSKLLAETIFPLSDSPPQPGKEQAVMTASAAAAMRWVGMECKGTLSAPATHGGQAGRRGFADELAARIAEALSLR